MITTTCKKYGRSFKLRDELAGRQGKCKCGAIVEVPKSDECDLAPTPAASVANSSYGSAFSSEQQPPRPRSAESPVVRNERFPGFDPLEAPRIASPSVPTVESPKEDGEAPKKRSSWIWSLVRVTVLLIVLGGTIFFTMAHFVFGPQHDRIQQTLRETVANAEKSIEMQKRVHQLEAEARDAQSRKALGMDEPEPALPPGPTEAEKAHRQKFLQDCEPFLREVKALQARLERGLSYNDFNNKCVEVIEAYAQLPKSSPDTEVAECIRQADQVLQVMADADTVWRNDILTKKTGLSHPPSEQALHRLNVFLKNFISAADWLESKNR